MRPFHPVLILLLVLQPWLLWGCKDEGTPPPPPPPSHTPTIQLSVADTGVTELWLRVRFVDSTQARSFKLLRDSQVIATATPAPLDTVIHDGLLSPHQSYSYKAYRLNNNVRVDSTQPVSATTMDTTSHNFVWRVDTLGESSSVLFDAAIIHDTLAYLVGEIKMRDSSGAFQPPYGLVSLSPSSRRLVRLYANGPLGRSILEPKGLHAFSSTNVWFANGGVFHWNGDTVTPYWINAFPGNPNPILDTGQGAEEVCGTSPTNLYALGTQGAIAFFDGQQWRRMNSGGTTVDLQDGSITVGTNPWVCGYRPSYSESILLRYNGSVWEEYGHSPPWGVYADLFGSVWFYKNDSAYVVGNLGVFRHAQSSPTGFRRIPIELGYFPYKIRGSARNDIAIVGAQGMIWHFNGMTWKRFDQLIDSETRLYSVAVGHNQIIAVGYRYYNAIERSAVIYHGRR